ncbi:MAG: SDR family NAD(P)-dependent oxidoreductase, partial [Bryobacteraceae bacterium]
MELQAVTLEQQRESRKGGPSKIALVTGGSEGLGAACVRQFLKAGWKVAILALPGPETDSMASSGVLTVSGDITSDETRRAAVEKTLARFDRIDVLVNNVG